MLQSGSAIDHDGRRTFPDSAGGKPHCEVKTVLMMAWGGSHAHQPIDIANALIDMGHRVYFWTSSKSAARDKGLKVQGEHSNGAIVEDTDDLFEVPPYVTDYVSSPGFAIARTHAKFSSSIHLNTWVYVVFYYRYECLIARIKHIRPTAILHDGLQNVLGYYLGKATGVPVFTSMPIEVLSVPIPDILGPDILGSHPTTVTKIIMGRINSWIQQGGCKPQEEGGKSPSNFSAAKFDPSKKNPFGHPWLNGVYDFVQSDFTFYSSFYPVVVDREAYQAKMASEAIRAKYVFVGIEISKNWSGLSAAEVELLKRLEGKKGVMVSFGITYKPSVEGFQYILRMLENPPQEYEELLSELVFAALGKKLPDGVKIPQNVEYVDETVSKTMSQQLMLASSVFISHMGRNALIEGMSAGLPFLPLPIQGDQFVNAEAARQAGSAVQTPPSWMGFLNQFQVDGVETLLKTRFAGHAFDSDRFNAEFFASLAEITKPEYVARAQEVRKQSKGIGCETAALILLGEEDPEMVYHQQQKFLEDAGVL